jgi:L-amino acid N-acyltransferase YncA
VRDYAKAKCAAIADDTYQELGFFMTELRLATAKDAEAIAAIYAPYVVTNAVSFESKTPSAREMKSRIEQGDGLYPWIVAAEGKVILGYASAKPFRPGATHRFGVEIAVYVAGDLEGKGIRRELLTALIATLTAQNFTQAICTLMTPNDKLIQLYESVGFRRAGQYREVCYKNGQWGDIGMWQRELSEAGSPPDEIKPVTEVGIVRA